MPCPWGIYATILIASLIARCDSSFGTTEVEIELGGLKRRRLFRDSLFTINAQVSHLMADPACTLC
jgi:hypothetical protein